MNFDVAITPQDFFLILSVQVNIVDLNDYIPTFPVNSTTLSILESVVSGSTFPLPFAVDLNSPEYGIQRYDLTPASNSQFSLRWTSTSLQLVVVVALDRETVSGYSLVVTAVSGGSSPLSGNMSVEVTVLDVNDNSPVFDHVIYSVQVSENTAVGMVLLTVHASDTDSAGVNSRVYYSWVQDDGGVSPPFTINPDSGVVTLSGRLDREKTSTYSLLVAARDGGTPSLTSSATVTVLVLDVNDNAPVITINTLTSEALPVADIPEDSLVGIFAALVTVTDADAGQNANISCWVAAPTSLTFGLVPLQYAKYKLVTLTSLDREREAEYNVTVVCRDNGYPPLSTNVTLSVNILDVNDNPPVFSQSSYATSIFEDNSPASFIITVTATDADSGENGRVTYSLGGDAAGLFYIDSNTGSVFTNTSFDRESTPSIQFLVIASDHGQPALCTSATVLVTILDVNDNSPKFTQPSYTFIVPEQEPANQSVGLVSATDADSGAYSVVRYTLGGEARGVFNINSNTGDISTARTLNSDVNDVYCLVIVASNDGYPQLTSNASVTVYVMDVKGNSIIIDFPDACKNYTVWVSSHLKTGQEVMAVKAHSLKDIQNVLSFEMGGQSETFTMDSITGVIYAKTDLSKFVDALLQFPIIVSDTTNPYLKSHINLTILISSSIDPPPYSLPVPLNSSNQTFNPNVIIIACISGVSGVITAVLLVSIICIVYRTRIHRRNGQKSCCNDVIGTNLCSTNDIREIPRVVLDKRSSTDSSNSSSGFISGREEERVGGGKPETGFSVQDGLGTVQQILGKQPHRDLVCTSIFVHRFKKSRSK